MDSKSIVVYFKKYNSIITARECENLLKADTRAKEVELIKSTKHKWKGLFNTPE